MTLPTHSPIAVVTGAGNGIGASFARLLYQQGYRLLLVDLRPENLQNVCEQLEREWGGVDSRVETHIADLTDRASVEGLAKRIRDTPDIDLLVNNAGFGSLEEFTDVDVERHAAMIAIHVETPMRLVHAVLPQMKSKNRGSIINVSSLGAFAPCAQAVQYASTKGYLVIFSEALQEELRETNIRVQALCPGFVRTDFHATDAMKNFHRRRIPTNLWTTPDEVASCSLRCLTSGRVVVIPGWRSRMMGLFMRMVLLKPVVRAATRPGKSLPSPAPNFGAPAKPFAVSFEGKTSRGA
ncbi:MAG: SDR family NAD(P)-dependent oxidoreductase [Planctomycetaceae bacterium]